jgi:energy-coupling factor transporter ATP-binding protein EcfA2
MHHEGSGATFGVTCVERHVVIRAIGSARRAALAMFAAVADRPQVDAVARLAIRGGQEGYRVDGGLTPATLDGSLGDAVRELRHQVFLHLMAARSDLLWLHAAAAARPGSAVLIVGPSGCGKSTMVAHLVRRGYQYLGDDLVPFESAGAVVHPVPLAPRIRRPSSWTVANDHVTRLPRQTLDVDARGVCRTPQRVGLIVFPTFTEGHCAAARCTMAETSLELLQHVVTDGDRDAFVLRTTCDLAAGAPALRMSYGDARAAVDVLERLHLQAMGTHA